MKRELKISLRPEIASKDESLEIAVANKLRVKKSRIKSVHIRKKSIDARKRKVLVHLDLEVYIDDLPQKSDPYNPDYKRVDSAKEIIVVGSGPAGLFAALRLLELGFRPIVLERGNDVHTRKRDIAGLIKDQRLNTESNYCFGEGGAGTFSDGKLYTRSKKRGYIRKILEVLSFHGATEKILYEAHPHIGSDKLPAIIEKIRETILDHGGEVHFATKFKDFLIQGGKIAGVLTENDEKVPSEAVILATGHSARDVYEIMVKNNLKLEAKTFAMGVRVEHPQSLINEIQYHGDPQMKYLPSAEYRLACQVEERGVFSFCMCPGGFIVPSATNENEVVVNGMSPSHRNAKYANSGIVVEIRPEDILVENKAKVLSGLSYQKKLEQMACEASHSLLTAPAQRLTDFLDGRISTSLPESSYFPGLVSSPMHEWLPELINKKLRVGFLQFGNRMKGYLSNEAIIVGVESRTSSPVRIPRDSITLEHPQLGGLFPCGEGAGYSGGIVSSAIDGERCAEAAISFLRKS
ncbi:MAG: NAD(P)/FAD-dependent oxidoreductase [Bacteroidales bacterium]|nr:NAD(P)/FAD-dependent oxidoreductase [Bacteroidales bacterium]